MAPNPIYKDNHTGKMEKAETWPNYGYEPVSDLTGFKAGLPAKEYDVYVTYSELRAK